MTRRNKPMADRLARAEASSTRRRWELTLDDGSTARLPQHGYLYAMREAQGIYRAREAGETPPEPSAKLRTVARGDLSAVSSVAESAAIQIAQRALSAAEEPADA